jgi:hypothetical protein
MDYLVLRIAPDWSQLQTAWDPCWQMLQAGRLEDDEVFALCMVIQELLENAVKYGAGGQPIQLEVRVLPDEVTIEVRNPLGVDNQHLLRFDRTIQWIRGFQDPFEAYVERLKVVSAQPYGEGDSSGLGLTRIAYEGRCDLDFYLDARETLAVSAVYRREGRHAS